MNSLYQGYKAALVVEWSEKYLQATKKGRKPPPRRRRRMWLRLLRKGRVG